MVMLVMFVYVILLGVSGGWFVCLFGGSEQMKERKERRVGKGNGRIVGKRDRTWTRD